MRAAFNTTCDLINGPGGPDPGNVRVSGACRAVPETHQLPTSLPLSDRVAYITMIFATPLPPLVTPDGDDYVLNMGWADMIAIPSGNIPVYQVLFVELVDTYAFPDYYRAHVREIPGLVFLGQESGYLLVQQDGSRILVT